MTKAKVILNAINNGATDEELVVLENTPEEQFAVEVKEEEEVEEVEEETTAPEVKEDLTSEDTTVKEESTVSTGEKSSTATSKVDWESPKLKGEWVFNETGDNVWTRKYKNEKGVLVQEVVPSNNVPKEVLKRHAGNNPVVAEIDAEKRGMAQTQAEWVKGKDDVAVSDQSVVENAAAFSATVDDKKVITNNIGSETKFYKNRLLEIIDINKQIRAFKDAERRRELGNIPLNALGADETGAEEALKIEQHNQNRVTVRGSKLVNPKLKVLLDKRDSLIVAKKDDRVTEYLEEAAKLWPKNDSKADEEEYNAWLYQTASALMEKDDVNGFMEKNIAQYMEDFQGIVQVMDPVWATKEVEKSKEFLEILPEKMQKNLAQQNFLKTSVNELDSDIKLLVEDLNKIDYSGYTADIEKYDNELAELGPEVKSGAFAWTQLTYDKYHSLIQKRNSVIANYQKEQKVDSETYQNYLSKVNGRNETYQQYLNTVNLDVEFNKQGEDITTYMNAMRRNGHNLTAAATWVSTSTLHMGTGIEGALFAVKELPEDLLFEFYDNDTNKMPEIVKMIHTIDGVYDAMRHTRKDNFQNYIDNMNASVQAPTKYEDIDGLVSLGTFGMHTIANFVPQLALIYATGGASIYIMGTSAFGNKYDNIEFTNRQKFGGTNYTLGEKWLASGVAFGSEVISERITYGIFKAKVGLAPKPLKRVTDAFSKSVYETTKRVVKRTISSTPLMGLESGSEVLAELGNNAGDKYVLGKNISLCRNLESAALSGLFMERVMSMPGLYQDASSIFSGKSYKQKIAENTKKRVTLENMLAEPSLNPKLREKLETDVLKLIAKSETLMAQNIENIDMMSNKEKGDLVKLDTEIIKLRSDKDMVEADGSLSYKQKQELIEDLTVQENDALNQQDDIVKEYESDETRKKKKERFDKQLKQIKKKVAKFNKRKIKDFKHTNDGARGRVKVFETREEQQAFFNDRMSDHNALLQSEREGWQEILKDPSLLNEADKAAIGLEDGGVLLDHHVEQINGVIKDIDNQIAENNYQSRSSANHYGGFAVNKDGVFEIFVNKENALAIDGNVNVLAHEWLHAILFKSIGKDPETQKALGDAVIDFIGNNKGGFTRQFIKKMEPYQRDTEFGEEIITVMSESIMDGTLKYKEGLFTKIGDIIRQNLQRLGLKGITFNSGKDVYNFIKDYNASIEKNYDSIAIQEMMDKGAKGTLLRKNKNGKGDSSIMSSKSPEKLIREINNPKKTSSEKAAAEEELTKQYDLLAIKALKYDTRKGDIARENVILEARKYLPGILKRFDPRSSKFSTYVNSNIAPKQAVIFEAAKGEFYGETTSINTKEAKQIEDTSSGVTNTQDTFVQKIDILGFATVDRVADKIKSLVKVKPGNNFKNIISNYAGKVGEIVFNIPAKKIMEGGANLAAVTKYKEGMPAPAEAQNIQRFFNAGQNADRFIKTLPLYNITDKNADIDKVGENIEVSRNAYGIAIGLKGLPLDYFYENYTDPKALSKDPEVYKQRITSKGGRSLGLTSQTAVKRLKPEFRNPMPEVVEQFKQDIGITPKGQENVYNRDIGQLLKGAAKVYSINASLSAAQRAQEAKLKKVPVEQKKAIKQQTADITAAQSKIAFSKAVKGYRDAKKLVSEARLAPKQQLLLEKEKAGELVGEIITMRGMQSYQDVKNNITYEEFYTNQLLDFFESYPQYYNLMSGALTGGIKRAAFFDKAYFDKVIKKFAKKNNKQNIVKAIKKADQVGPKRLYYHSGSKFKGLKNLDLTIDNGKVDFLIKLFNDISKHTKKQGKEIFQEVLTHFGIDQNNFMRKSAPLIGYPVNEKGKEITNKKGVEEHAVQMEMARIMMGSAFDGNMKDGAKLLRATYSQISLLEVEDPGGQYKQSMGNDFYNNVVPRVLDGSLDFLPDGFVSIYRLMKAGVNPFGYKLIGPKQTIAEYFGVNNLSIEKAKQSIIDVFEGKQDINALRAQSGIKYAKDIDGKYVFSKAINRSRTVNPEKGITVLDFDDTLATSKSLVISTSADGTVRKLTAEQFAQEGADLLDQGWTHDFSEFSKVVDGKTAPLFQKALKLQEKFGNNDMFVLTARPANSAPAIFEFLKANGLNIPLKNITGLANSTPESKALWMADKVGEGYNDFYFADDALQNVQAVKNMLDQFDVKSKVQQAKIKFSKAMNTEFNDILESTTGILSQKQFSDAQAKLRGRKTKYKSIIPASAQDFQGLLYNFLGKGKKGEADMAFFKKALMNPFARGINELNGSKQSAANDFENLNKNFPDVKKKLNKNIEGLDYTNDQAMRVYLWNKSGFEVPGLSKRDLAALTSVIENNLEMKAYADAIGLISKKQDGYSKPKDYWLAENIASDLLSDGAIGDARADFLAEWQQNVDQIFSKENLNKIQAIYGNNFREALEDSLYRMKNGKNRPTGRSRIVNAYMNWVNNSVGAIMFFNMRSAALQTISAANYMNWSFNNPAKAAMAFANQSQYWKDFSMIFNSNYLKQRRSGNQRGVNEAEISEAVAASKNKPKAAIAWLLKKGFLPTQIADSFAIASGGATFYRNKVKALVKEGVTQEQAEKQAFLDFQESTEVSQQSARPDMISQQQASPLGRLILAFQNTPMQYARIINKSARDLVNGRGDTKTHISKIAYYGVAQGIIFGALQAALFAALGEDEEEEFDKKKERIMNQMVDSLLSGIGVGGKAISTVKNTIMEYAEQKDKGWNADHAYTLLTLLGFSPPIGSKLRKVYSSIQTEKFNEGVSEKRGLTLDNPSWSKWGNVIEGVTNVPLGRLAQKMLNIDNALDENNKWWERAALLMGWNTWDLGIKDPDITAVKDEIKEEKKAESKIRAEEKREQKEREKEEANKAIIEENKKKSKKDGICSAVSKGGKRCKTKIVEGKLFCTVHEKAEQNETGEKSQCKKIKKGNKRCKMQTSNKSGYCYYHD